MTEELSLAQDSGVAAGNVQPGTVTVVIVTFNSAAVICEALQALQDCPDICRTIVVDNASSDQTTTLVSKRFPDIHLIKSPENIGFGPANNLGLNLVTSKFAFVLNPDAVVNPTAVSTLVKVANEHSNAAIVGPLLQQPGENRRAIRTGSVWEPKKTRIPPNADLEVKFLVGAAMFLRMSLVRHSGFFDPNIFLFHEDDDICTSARRAGHSVILTSKAVISHLVGQSTPADRKMVAFKQCHFTWSRFYLEEKEHGRESADQLAQQTLGKLGRKRMLARLLKDKTKQQQLQARTYAAKCFLNHEAPSTVPKDFAH